MGKGGRSGAAITECASRMREQGGRSGCWGERGGMLGSCHGRVRVLGICSGARCVGGDEIKMKDGDGEKDHRGRSEIYSLDE